MTGQSFEDVLKEFKEAAPPLAPPEASVVIQSISIGVPVPGDVKRYSESITMVDGIGPPVVTLDTQLRDVHTFTVDNEWLSGTATVVVNRVKGTLTCDATGLVVTPDYKAQGFVVQGYDVGCLGQGDHDGDTLVRSKKKNKHSRGRVTKDMMNLLGRATQ